MTSFVVLALAAAGLMVWVASTSDSTVERKGLLTAAVIVGGLVGMVLGSL